MDLPPGFRFHPTDEELITHYLSRKVAGKSLSPEVIGELDLNRCEPWDLPSRSKLGEEWYFFCVRDKKYPTGLRTNRATGSGYWKATGKDKEIHRRKITVGMKKTLVFYKGRAPKGEKTNWIMHEYRLEGKQPKDNDWVMCRVFYRSCSGQKDVALIKLRSCQEEEMSSSSAVPLMNDPYSSKDSSVSDEKIHVTCFSNALEGQKGYEELLANSYNSSFLSTDNAPWSSFSPSKKSQKSFFSIRHAPSYPVILQHDYTSSAAVNNAVETCLLNYQFLHLDAWPSSQ